MKAYYNYKKDIFIILFSNRVNQTSPCCKLPMYIEISTKLGIKILCIDKWASFINNPNSRYYCPINPIYQSILSTDQIEILDKISEILQKQAQIPSSSYSFFDNLSQETSNTIDFDYISKSVSRKIGGGEYKYSSLRNISGY